MRLTGSMVRGALALLLALSLVACGGGGDGDGGGGTDVSAGDSGSGGGGADVALPCESECTTSGDRRCVDNNVEICGNYDDDACLEWGGGEACEKENSCSDGYCMAVCEDECSGPGALQCEGNAVQTCGNHDDDACLEWGGDQDCGDDTCASGYCVSGCENDCPTPNARQCDGNSVQICADHDDDPCLEWGGDQDCGDDTCTAGYCVSGCADDCPTANARRCADNSVETCANHDEDPCLEWGGAQDCGDDTCADGYCVSGCENDCTDPGARRCDDNATQICGDHDDDPCLEWGGGEECGDAVCMDGFCGMGCDDDCTVDGARRCADDGFQVCGNYDGDPCLEWGTTTDCPASQTCSSGHCRTSCVDECTVMNARRCDGPSGYATCGNYDSDTCLEWSTAVDCATGEICSNGFCSTSCVSECTVLGARRCDGDAVQTCGDANNDSCLEWGTPAPCAQGESCSNGFCSSTCVSECSVSGARRCSGDAVETCGDADLDGCLEWGTAVPCGAVETCSNGYCSSSCSNECNVFGAVRCSGDAVQTCGDTDADGCLAWETAVPCGADETCSNGHCSSSCVDECTVVGARRCDGDAVEVCGDTDEDGCLEWGTRVPCDAAQTCSNGHCALDCENECTLDGAQRCASTGSYQVCSDHDADGCLEWNTPVGCEAGETCSGGTCVNGCVSACTYIGARQCDDTGDAYEVCGDTNDDGCLEWGTPVACPDGTSCSAGGVCALGCTDACTVVGARRCAGASSYEVCGDANGDGCLEWGSTVPCEGAEVCSNGNCALDCADECDSVGARKCSATGGYQVCDEYDTDGCLEWGTEVVCEGELVCDGGYCASACSDQCDEVGATQCNGSETGVLTCGDFNEDGCLEWSDSVPCGETESCTFGACATVPVPGEILISEVLYDSVGTDADVFVELFGDPGLDLSGFVVVGVNGSNGQTYQPIVLSGSIPSDGFYVIADPAASDETLAAADLLDADVDYQNGPDSIQIRWGDTIVDAVGYGDFTNSTFGGEGDPAVDPATEGHSLGRDGGMTDTDDNLTDFAEMDTPTPGTFNGEPNVRPVAALVCPAGGNLRQNLTFDASNSTDADGAIVSYRFDFGDGSVATGPADTVVHAYTVASAYTVTLTVTDNQGGTGSATCSLTVSDDTAPTVILLDPLEDIQVTQGSVVSITAHATPGPQRSIAQVELLVDGEVVGDVDDLPPYEFTYTVPAESTTDSTQLIQARATDNEGVVGTSAARQLFVRNDMPVATFTAVITGSLGVRLDASAVSDTETATAELEVRWDFDNDGVFDTDWSTTKVLEHTYLTDGEHTIVMEVRDTVDQVTTASRSVNFQLTQSLYGEVTSTTWYGTITITGDAWVPAGETLVISAGTTVVFVEDDSQPADGVGDNDLVINGTLVVEGTEEEPVVFTVRPADPDAGGSARSWNTVRLASGSSGHSIEHAIFEYADRGLHAQTAADLSDVEFRFNRIGAHFESASGTSTLIDVNTHDNTESGLWIANSAVESTGLVSTENGGHGVRLDNASAVSFDACTVTYNDENGFDIELSSPVIDTCTITHNAKVGLHYEGQGAGSVTYSQVKYNGHEGVRLVPANNITSSPVITWNNIFGNGANGSLVITAVNLTASGNTSQTSTQWTAPGGSKILYFEDYYDETEYNTQSYYRCNGYVRTSSSGTTYVSHSSDSSRRWNTAPGTYSSIVAQTSVSHTYSRATQSVYNVAYVDSTVTKQFAVLSGASGSVDARHNYFGVWPNVLEAITYNKHGQVDVSGFVNEAFTDTWDKGPCRGGSVINEPTVWDTAAFPDGIVYVTGALRLGSGATLDIAPGMTVLFVPTDIDRDYIGDYNLDAAAGVLTIGAESGLSVSFGVFTDGGAMAVPSGGGYHGVRLDAASGSIVAYNATIEGARWGLWMDIGAADLHDVTVRGNVMEGVRLSGSAALTADNLVAENNGTSGLFAGTSGAVVLSRTTAQNNPQWGVLFDDAHSTGNEISDSYLSCNGQGGLLVESAYVNAHHNNIMNNGDTSTGVCTLSVSSAHKGFGVWLRGDANGAITDNNIEVNRFEGLYGTVSVQGNPTAVTITGNNIAQNALTQAGTDASVSISASGNTSTNSTVYSTPTPDGGGARPPLEFVKCYYDETEYNTQSYYRCSGDLMKSTSGSTSGTSMQSWSYDSSLRWYDILSYNASQIFVRTNVSHTYSRATASCSGGLYHSPTGDRTVEAAFVIGSGTVTVTGNYWGGRTTSQVIVTPDAGSWSSSGYETDRISGTGPRL